MTLDAAEPLGAQRRMNRHRRASADGAGSRPAQWQARDAAAIRRDVERAHDDVERRLLFGEPETGHSRPGAGNGNGGNNAADPTDPEGPAAGGAGGAGGAATTTRSSTTSSSTRLPATSTSATRCHGLLDCIAEPFTRSHSSSSSTSSSTSTSSSSSTRSSTRTTSTVSSDTTSTTSSSSTSTSSSSSSSLTSSSTSSTSALPTLTTPTPSTATAVAFVTSSSIATLASATASLDAKSDGPGAGPIIGIVAGALAGVAVLAALIGFLVKKYKSSQEDPYEANPFDRDDFRRQSAMLPDQFDDDDGHQPSMSEHHHASIASAGYGMEQHDGMGMGAAAGVGAGLAGAAAAGAYAAHNQGGPRPPTMFERHINGPAAQYSNAPPPPTVGAYYNQDPAPSLPPIAFGTGGDPYSLAGVGNSHSQMNNVNPYAHLNRGPSLNGYGAPQQPYRQQASQYDDAAAAGAYGGRPESGSSSHSGPASRDLTSPFANPHEQQQYGQAMGGDEHAGRDYNYSTTGRPQTAEGRSGTPDLPDVQQTYQLDDEAPQQAQQHSPEIPRAASPFGALDAHGSGAPLQVRNLMPGNQHAARPLSTNSTADPSDAYGGCY